MSGPAAWSRWPNLGGISHPQLDWHVTVYEAGQIRQMADAAEQGDWNPWTKATVTVLRALANSPAALKELNEPQDTIPREVMGLNRVVHYLVRLEIAGNSDKAKARKQVGDMWRRAPDTVKADLVDYGDAARRVIDELLQSLQTIRGKTRAELLDDFDLDMIHRAKHMRREK